MHGIEHDLKSDSDVVPDDASSLTEADEPADDAAASDDKSVDLGKKDKAEEPAETPADTEAAEAKSDDEPKKTDGDSDAK